MPIASLLVALLCFTGTKQARGGIYPDIPENHFAYDTLSRLQSKGVLPEREILGRGNWPLRRSEIAQLAVHASMNFDLELSRLQRGAINAEDAKHAKELRSIFPALQQLTATFAADMPRFVDGGELLVHEEQQFETLDHIVSGR